MNTEVEPFRVEEISGDVRATYDRLDGEGHHDYALFKGYLDLGSKRSVRLLADRIAVGRDKLQMLCVRNSWVVRAADFDQELTRRALAELEGEGLEMRGRHAAAAKEIMEKAMEAVRHLDARFLIPRDIPVWIDVASKLERSSRGVQDAAKRVEVTGAGGGPIEVANSLSAEDRRALLAAVNEQIAIRLSPEIEQGIVDAEVIEDTDAR